MYLVDLIRHDFPNITVTQNDRNLLPLGLEVDIHIPHIKLTIEVNGPVHYLPLYGEPKLKKIQAADELKRAELRSAGCRLVVIDTSAYGYFVKVKAMLDERYWSYIKPLLDSGMPEERLELS